MLLANQWVIIMSKRIKNPLYQKWKNYILTTKQTCDTCGKKIFYFCKYDAEFCSNCNKWLRSNCGDPDCSYCGKRPETPEHALMAYNNLLDKQREYYYQEKERAMRHYSANEKHRKKIKCKHELYTLLAKGRSEMKAGLGVPFEQAMRTIRAEMDGGENETLRETE